LEHLTKIATVVLIVFAFVTFWPLVVFLLAGIAGFVAYTSWKTNKMMKESQTVQSFTAQRKQSSDIIEAEYTEKEMNHE